MCRQNTDTLVAATGNKGKLQEFKLLLPSFEILSMAEAGFLEEIEETGSTFEENALLKARAVMRATGRAAFADDSGLMVDALGGAPGIYSARYAGETATDAERIEKLLSELSSVPEEARTASFVSVIAYVTPDGEEKTFRGECHGRIGKAPKGEHGFGYDPVFISAESGRTFAEMTEEEKGAISHRGRAMRLFADWLEK